MYHRVSSLIGRYPSYDTCPRKVYGSLANLIWWSFNFGSSEGWIFRASYLRCCCFARQGVEEVGLQFENWGCGVVGVPGWVDTMEGWWGGKLNEMVRGVCI